MSPNTTKDAVDLNFLTHKNAILTKQNNDLSESLAKLKELNSQYEAAIDEAVKKLEENTVTIVGNIDVIKQSHSSLLELIDHLTVLLKEYEARHGSTAKGVAILKTSEAILKHKKSFL